MRYLVASIEIKSLKSPEDRSISKTHILDKHYLGRWPKAVQEVLGIFHNNEQIGTLVYGIGTRGQATREIFRNDDGSPVLQNNQMWELQRAFTTDAAKKQIPNLGSMVISRGNEWIRQNAKTTDGKPVKAILSYADSSAGHKGSVYQSTNATYLGEQKPLPYFIVSNPESNKEVRLSQLTKKAYQLLSDEGYDIKKIKPPRGKHKFVYALGKDQTERDQLLSKIIKPIFDYPDEHGNTKQIPNGAKERISKKPAQQPNNKAPETPESKRSTIKKLLNSKVKNPETGNDILVKTALKYDKTHPSYKQAHGMVQAWSKRFGIRVKSENHIF